MKNEIRERFPSFVDSMATLDLVMSDDLDSHLTCKIVQMAKGYEVNYFYDFGKVYRIAESPNKWVGVDISFCKGKCFDNHVTLLSEDDERYNKQSANINNILGISRDNYTEKYAGSTLLQVISLYNVLDLKHLTDEQKVLLWCVDSAYMGHYRKPFQDTHNKYIELLELEELATVLDKYPESVFDDCKAKYNSNKKIWINDDGRLETTIDIVGLQALFPGIDMSLPQGQFTLHKEFQKPKQGFVADGRITPKHKMVSMALTGRNKVKYTLPKAN